MRLVRVPQKRWGRLKSVHFHSRARIVVLQNEVICERHTLQV